MVKNDKKITGVCKCGAKDDFYRTIDRPRCWQCDAPLDEVKV